MLRNFSNFVLDYPIVSDWITYLPEKSLVDLFILPPKLIVVISLLFGLYSCGTTFYNLFFKKESEPSIDETSDDAFWQDFDADEESVEESGGVEKDSDEDLEEGIKPNSEQSPSTGGDVIAEGEGDLILELGPKNSGEVIIDKFIELAEWLIGKARELLGLMPEVEKMLQENIFPVIKALVKQVFKYVLVGLAMVCWTWLVKLGFYLYINHLSGWCCFMEDSIQSDWCIFLKNGVEQNFNDLCIYVLGKKGARYAICYLQLFLFRSNLVVAVLVLAVFKWF